MSSPHWYIFLTCSVSLGTVVFCLFLVTSSPVYTENCFKVSLLFCLLLCALSLSVYLQLSEPDSDSQLTDLSLGNVSTNFIITDLSESGLFALYVEVRPETRSNGGSTGRLMPGLAANLHSHSSPALRHSHPGLVLLLFTGDFCWLYLHFQVDITSSAPEVLASLNTLFPGTASLSW